jgi:F-type H+-transporting ATPase subunit b
MAVLVGVAVLVAGPGMVRAMESAGDSHAPASSAAHGGDAHKASDAGHGGGHGGHHMPVWEMFFIQLAGFILLILVAKKFAWPAIRKGLDARRDGIAGAFSKAEAEEREAQRLLTEYEDKLRGFAMEAKRRRDEAVRQGRMMRLQIEEEARLQARQMMEKSRREGELMQARARAEVRKTVLIRAFDEAANRLRAQVDDRAQGALFDRFLGDLEKMPTSS